MDFVWKCNVTACRSELQHQAVVTTCSHIFCLNCAGNSGLAAAVQGVRVCPACETQLVNPDDAVITQLDPSEDYKTSVLSGFTPTLIMECASRALAFYNYQAIHEATYQDYLAKRLTQKVAGLNDQLDNTIKDANGHIHKLQAALKDAESRVLEMDSRNAEVQNAFRQKAKALSEITKKYEALKSEKMAAQTMNAASDEAEQMLQTMTGSRFASGLPSAGLRWTGSGSSENAGAGFNLHSMQRLPAHARSQSRGYTAQPMMQSNPLFVTPHAKRTTMSIPGTSGRAPHATNADGGSQPFRQPLGDMSNPAYPRNSNTGYGMRNGVKVSRLSKRTATPNLDRHTMPTGLPVRR